MHQGRQCRALVCFPGSNSSIVGCNHALWLLVLLLLLVMLQGALGRFGAVELSDVAAFVELPDGKVLSGSEAGDLLLWEGGLIKAVICRWVGWWAPAAISDAVADTLVSVCQRPDRPSCSAAALRTLVHQTS